MIPPIKPVPVQVSASLLRRLFDAMGIFDKVSSSFFTSRLYWQSKNTPTHLASGSASQIWEYLNAEGRVFARVHLYRDPLDLPIGRPDPKYLRINQVALYIGAAS